MGVFQQPDKNKKAMGSFPWLYNLAEPWVIFLTHSPLCQ
jgi:hypothetical protein